MQFDSDLAFMQLVWGVIQLSNCARDFLADKQLRTHRPMVKKEKICPELECLAKCQV